MRKPIIKPGCRRLVEKIEELKKSKVKKIIDSRLKEFSVYQNASVEDIFLELCFCITTANCAAESCIRMQEEIGSGYNTFSEKKLSDKLKQAGYRFPNKRSNYIVKAREHREAIAEKIREGSNEKDIREWLDANVLGLGLKEASHFLRNVGFLNLAIIDFHIVDILVEYGIIEEPKTLTKSRYLEIEQVLRDLALETGLSLSELDLYLWFMETGKVLK